MATPFPSRPTGKSTLPNPAFQKSHSPEWRCSCCGKLLGVLRNGELHLRFSQGHEYLVALPATCTCRCCKTLNRMGPLRAR